MFNAKSLTEDQVATIRSWAEAGDDLSGIQKKLNDELSVKVTYLETRFLLEDLKIDLLPEPTPEPEEETTSGEEDQDDSSSAESSLLDADGEAVGERSGVSVTVDQVQRPGAIVSGQANFGGGNTAAWYLDQLGRLGFEPSDPEYHPSEEQMMDFQKELQTILQKQGF
ncbi:MAG: hypothetical protein AAF357_07810 [Verrucomicrobiota bacterium]